MPAKQAPTNPLENMQAQNAGINVDEPQQGGTAAAQPTELAKIVELLQKQHEAIAKLQKQVQDDKATQGEFLRRQEVQDERIRDLLQGAGRRHENPPDREAQANTAPEARAREYANNSGEAMPPNMIEAFQHKMSPGDRIRMVTWRQGDKHAWQGTVVDRDTVQWDGDKARPFPPPDGFEILQLDHLRNDTAARRTGYDGWEDLIEVPNPRNFSTFKYLGFGASSVLALKSMLIEEYGVPHPNGRLSFHQQALVTALDGVITFWRVIVAKQRITNIDETAGNDYLSQLKQARLALDGVDMTRFHKEFRALKEPKDLETRAAAKAGVRTVPFFRGRGTQSPAQNWGPRRRSASTFSENSVGHRGKQCSRCEWVCPPGERFTAHNRECPGRAHRRQGSDDGNLQ